MSGRWSWVGLLGVLSLAPVGCEGGPDVEEAPLAVSPGSITAGIGMVVELEVSVGPPIDPRIDTEIPFSARIERSTASPVVDEISEDDLSSRGGIAGFEIGSSADYRVGRNDNESVHTLRLRCLTEGVATVHFECVVCDPSAVSATVRCTGGLLDAGTDAGESAGPDASVDGGTGAVRTPLVVYTAGPPGLSSARHIYVRTLEGETYQLDTSLDADARVEDIIVSPDGEQILFSVANSFGYLDVYVVPTDGSEEPRLLSRSDDGVEALLPAAPGFARVAYQRNAPSPLYSQYTTLRPDGTDYVDLATGTEQAQSFIGFSPDGMWAAFDAHDSAGGRHLWTVRSDGTELGSMADNAINPYEARWSSTSNHLFFRGYDTAAAVQLFVGPADRSSAPTQLTTNGSGAAAWIASDAGLVHSDTDPVSGERVLCRRAPPAWECDELFRSSTASVFWARSSPDGSRIVFRTQEGSAHRLYEVPTDGSAAAHVISMVAVQEYDFHFSGDPSAASYAFTSSEGTFFQPVESPFTPTAAARVGERASRIIMSRHSGDMAFILDSDDDGADELYVQRMPTGGGTELPPIALVSEGGDFVRDAAFVPGGIVFQHDTWTEGSLVSIMMHLFDVPGREEIAEAHRIARMVGMPF